MKASLVLLWVALGAAALHAQISEVNTTASGTGSGTGTRLMWYPGKAAFRAGNVNGAQWDDANVGAASVAFGINNQVTSEGGFAAGNNNVVAGWWSTALGGGNQLLDVSGTFANGFNHLAINGNYCGFVAGNTNTVSKSIAVAIGEGNTSVGWGAMTYGRQLVSAAAGCVVVGMGNVPIVGNDTYWVGSDPVFIVGNGAYGTQQSGVSAPYQSNALEIYKNGQIKMPTVQGDIAMGEFGP